MILKFRVYCYETDEFIIADNYRDLADLFSALDTDDGFFSEIMQSTGMFDKNGKEIYEGDVVECEKINVIYANDCKHYELKQNFKGVVKQINGCFVIKSNTEGIYLYSGIDGIKIIGHKYMEDYKEFLND